MQKLNLPNVTSIGDKFLQSHPKSKEFELQNNKQDQSLLNALVVDNLIRKEI